MPGRLVLVEQAGVEEQRVVGPERDRRARTDERAQRDLLGSGVDPERDVGARAHLERDARVDDGLEHPWVLDAADSVAEPVRVQRGERLGHSVGAEQLTAVRDEPQPGPGGDVEGLREVAGVPPSLVVGEPEAEDPARAGQPCGEPRQGAGLERVPGATRGHEHADPGGAGRLRGRVHRRGLVEDDLHRRGDAADEGGIRARVDLDLQPSRALRGVVGRGLADHSTHGLLAAHDVPGGVVEPLEAEPPALVGSREPRRVPLVEHVRQAHALPVGKVSDGVHAHGPGEVQVQVGLGQRPQVPARAAQSRPRPSEESPSMTCTAASSAEAAPPSMPTSWAHISWSVSSRVPSS